MKEVLISAAGLSLATIIGSLIGFKIKELPHKLNDAVMGFCAGVMLAASTLGLIQPAAEAVGIERCWIVIIGVVCGMFFLRLLDFITPHLHKITGLDDETHTNNANIDKIILFVLAIALHKLPEGLATGVDFNAEHTGDAWAVTIGIALQNIPEGMVVIVPLLLAGVSKLRTFIISLVIALLEVVGVLIGYGVGSISELMLPALLAFSGGAMLYLVCDEMIPETHTHTHGNLRFDTYALIIGFLLIMFMEMAL